MDIQQTKELAKLSNTFSLYAPSDAQKLFRVTAYCSHFVARLRRLTFNKNITVAEVTNAQNMWIKHLQQNYLQQFHKDIQKCRNSQLTNLNLQLDANNIIRCINRVGNTEDAPILLPQTHNVTKLLIHYFHTKLMHAGVTQTLAEFRTQFWCFQGRRTVTNALQNCYVCKRFKSHALKLPDMAPYPVERITRSSPFQYTGCDYFGPLFATEHGEQTKQWVCLFTCLCTRAIHLEVVNSLTPQDFLMALRRLIARRGKPIQIYSDNSTTFKATQKTLNNLEIFVKNDNIDTFLRREGISWHFFPPGAPWMGGIYERIIGLTKQVLRITLGRSKVNQVQLLTLLVEVEAIINSRPLTFVSDEASFEKVITPKDFLSLNPSTTVHLHSTRTVTTDLLQLSNRNSLLETWKKGINLLESFWQMWQKEYLQNLRQRCQRHLQQHPKAQTASLQIGDVVIINDSTPRAIWKTGRITILHQSLDGKIRSVTVQLASGRHVIRPVNHLYLLETDNQNSSNQMSSHSVQGKQRRQSFLDAQKHISG